MRYYIYHIPGIKIGCTKQLEKRMRDQGFTEYEILEEHEDIYVASDREIELQKQYGYPVDKLPYYQAVSNLELGKTTESSSRGGKTAGNIQGRKNVESGHWDRIRKLRKPNSKEHQFKLSSSGGKAQKGKPKSKEHKSKLSIAAKNNRATCKYCGLESNKSNITRHERDTCKKRA